MLSTPNTPREEVTVQEPNLINGATPLVFQAWKGGPMERDMIGRVIATNFGNSKYAVWTMASDDQGLTWECFWGRYVDTRAEAVRLYNLKGRS